MKIIQISDIHLHKNPKERIFGLVNTDETFQDVLDKVIKEAPDFVIATGDLSQDGSIESYQRLLGYLNRISCDVYTIYGNHDVPHNLDSALIANNVKNKKYLQTMPANFIFLNSFKRGSDSGFISESELQNLEAFLNNSNNCIPVIHHHFTELNYIIDSFILENKEQLLNLLLKYKHKIKFCITGHVHNSFDIDIMGLKIHCGLSTCIQFAQTTPLSFANKKPGYTVYNFIGNTYEILEKTI